MVALDDNLIALTLGVAMQPDYPEPAGKTKRWPTSFT